MSYKPTNLIRKTIEEGGQLILRDKLSSVPAEGLPFGDKTRASASILCVPIRNGVNVIGVLSIESYKHQAYDQLSLETLQALADYCGGALNRLKSEEVLRQTEQQLLRAQKMEAIGLLAGGVAHDFNNLLTIILGNTQLAIDNDSKSAASDAEYLNEIFEAAQRAAKLTQQLLAFGRKQAMFAKPLNLNELITQLNELLKRIIGLDIQIQCAFEGGLPLINADASMLDQVVMNLVVNARDAMPEGGQIDISTRMVDIIAAQALNHPEGRAGRFVCLSVKDTGTGIARKDLSHIFEPFFTTKEVGKGTGLGLSTVFGIVKQHLGWVEVSSTVGVGTIFQVFIPALESLNRAPVQARGNTPVCGGNQGILLVDDEPAVRRISRRFLEEAGYHLFEASSGQEALEVWTRHSKEIDLLLTDISMPGGMNGRVLASRLTVSRPNFKVLFMSGYSADIPNDNVKNIQRDNSRFIQKPCARDELLRVIRDFLEENTVS